MKITITEALAEVKTIGKRVEKKRQFVATYLFRQDRFKDPLEKDGGSPAAIERELQALGDLNERVVRIRRAISDANAENMIKLGDVERSISDWLVWRREVAPGLQAFYTAVRDGINKARGEATKAGLAVRRQGDAPEKPEDVVINIDEMALAKKIEDLEQVLGELDGRLSLKNATIVIDIA